MTSKPTSLKTKLAGAAAAGAMGILLVLVPHFEGTETTPYKDMGGVMTVCTGHTGDVQANRKYTVEECTAILSADLTESLAEVDRLVKVPLPVKVRAALADFVFNLGGRAFGNSTLLRRINAGEGVKACAEILKWDHIGRVKVKGLTRRREIEYWLCVEGFEGR